MSRHLMILKVAEMASGNATICAWACDTMYNVIIVDAGPAGSMAARFLAERSVRVLLVDRRVSLQDTSYRW